ncbi:hypothetical protein [Devosia sp.]|uniref:hypothetical protein n=1 Tax=Devosia sp. TaxID=1871048 RepID=UPI001B035E83|nr:hypothetical protein [Devosia sp.]MBO9589515.1 hypothetical protein [Devosia sp.]
MRELWKPVAPFGEDEDRGFAFGGLELWEVADMETGEVDALYRTLSLSGGPTLLILLCDEDRAFHIASDFASRRDWTKIDDWDGIDLYPEQIDVIALYPGEAVPPGVPYLGEFDGEEALPPTDWE